MIDYDKLKIAHELINKYCAKNIYRQINLVTTFNDNIPEFYTLEILENNKIIFDWIVYRESEVIIKLQELTQEQPRSKYKIGEHVWFISCDGGLDYQPIEDMDYSSDEKYYIHEDKWFKESELYSTRGACIEAQVQYWSSLKESDGEDNWIKPCPACGNAHRKDFPCFKVTRHEFEDEESICGYPHISLCDGLIPNFIGYSHKIQTNSPDSGDEITQKCAHESDCQEHLFKYEDEGVEV